MKLTKLFSTLLILSSLSIFSGGVASAEECDLDKLPAGTKQMIEWNPRWSQPVKTISIGTYPANESELKPGSSFSKLHFLHVSTSKAKLSGSCNNMNNKFLIKKAKYSNTYLEKYDRCASSKSFAENYKNRRNCFFENIPSVKSANAQRQLQEKNAKGIEDKKKAAKLQKKKQAEILAKKNNEVVIGSTAATTSAKTAPLISDVTSQKKKNAIVPVVTKAKAVTSDTGGPFKGGTLITDGVKCAENKTAKDIVNKKEYCFKTTTARDKVRSKQTLAQTALKDKELKRKEAIENKKVLAAEAEKQAMKEKKIAAANKTDKESSTQPANKNNLEEEEIGEINIAQGKKADPNGSYDVGGVSVPGSEINDINKQANDCLKEKGTTTPEKKQENIDLCKNEAVASCLEPGRFCKNITDNAVADDNEVSEDAKVIVSKIDSTTESIKNRLDPSVFKIDCMAYFEGNKEENGVGKSTGNFLKKSLAFKEGASKIVSMRVDDIMYNDPNSCNEIFGVGQKPFTDVRQKLRVTDVEAFCLDSLQASFYAEQNTGEKGVCWQAFEDIDKGYVGNGVSCINEAHLMNDSSGIDDFIKVREDKEKALNKICKDSTTPEAKELCKTRYSKDLNSSGNKKEITDGCNKAYTHVKACLEDNTGSQNFTRMAAGCIGLNQIATQIKETVLEGSDEDSYESIDSKIRCRLKEEDSMVYAIDYAACRKAAYWYNGAFLATDLAAPVIGNAMSVYKDADIQADMAKDQMKGGVDAQTAAFRAQKRQYKNKADNETTQGVMQAGKAMAMFGNMMMYPTPKVVSNEWCVNGNVEDIDISATAACAVAYIADGNSDLKKQLYANQGMKDVMLKTGAEALSKAIVHAIIAGTYKKQSKLVGQVEDALANADFNQPENKFPTGPEFCAQNPTVPSCRGYGGGRIANNGVDFSFDGIAPQGGGNLDFEDEGTLGEFESSNNAVRPSGDSADDLNNILASDSDKKLGKGFNKIGAAGVGADKGGGGGGGGGGGPSGGGGGGGGGSEGPGAGGPSGTASDGGPKGFGKYVSGSGGRFSSGGSVSKKKKSRNPYAALSNRKRNRKIASQIDKQLLPKKSKLFEVISRRYAEVNKSDRLHKIETK